MKRGVFEIITETNASVVIDIDTANGDIWLTAHEIANIFQVYVQSVTSNLRVIFKEGELIEDEVTQEETYTKKGSTYHITYYNLDTIIALAFRCKGPICKRFRIWLRNQAKRPMTQHQPLIIQIGKDMFLA